jgi:hypothetical protein
MVPVESGASADSTSTGDNLTRLTIDPNSINNVLGHLCSERLATPKDSGARDTTRLLGMIYLAHTHAPETIEHLSQLSSVAPAATVPPSSTAWAIVSGSSRISARSLSGPPSTNGVQLTGMFSGSAATRTS